MTTLFGLGAFLGRISKENVLISGLRMIIVGAATAFIVLVLRAIPA
jgi:VIT1/CCC1 family predicted Fe2+/Mn2+ transporter